MPKRLLTALILSLATLAASAADIVPASLVGITIADEIDGSSYKRRADFGDWKDFEGDGKDTRHEVLANESLVPVTWTGNKVTAGLWCDPFTRKTFTSPTIIKASGRAYAIVQIDHIVPLKEAYESGAKAWTKDRRVKYANDQSNPGHLVAVHGPTNGSKGHKDPAEWMPPNEGFHCAYVRMWSRIKKEWGLSMDKDEYNAIVTVLASCP